MELNGKFVERTRALFGEERYGRFVQALETEPVVSIRFNGRKMEADSSLNAVEVADKIIRNDLSVRATEKLADRIKDELKPERKRRRKAADEEIGKTPEMKAVEAELRSLIGTKVNIRGDEKKGRIEMEYYSLEELNRLIDILREAGR